MARSLTYLALAATAAATPQITQTFTDEGSDQVYTVTWQTFTTPTAIPSVTISLPIADYTSEEASQFFHKTTYPWWGSVISVEEDATVLAVGPEWHHLYSADNLLTVTTRDDDTFTVTKEGMYGSECTVDREEDRMICSIPLLSDVITTAFTETRLGNLMRAVTLTEGLELLEGATTLGEARPTETGAGGEDGDDNNDENDSGDAEETQGRGGDEEEEGDDDEGAAGAVSVNMALAGAGVVAAVAVLM